MPIGVTGSPLGVPTPPLARTEGTARRPLPLPPRLKTRQALDKMDPRRKTFSFSFKRFRHVVAKFF